MASSLFQKSGLFTLLVTTLGVFSLMGCGSSGGGGSSVPDFSASASASIGPGIITSKAIDSTTRQGVSGATVKLFTSNASQSVTTATDDPATTDVNEAGDFQFSNVPAGQHRLRIESPNYASYEVWVTVQPSTTANYVSVGNEGRIELQLGCAVDVFVTYAGKPLPGATVYASVWNAPEVVGTTDDAGKVSLTGLAQNVDYNIVAPALDRGADGKADGTYDYLTTARSHRCSTSDATLALDMNKAGRDDGIQMIGSTADKYHSFMTGFSISPSDDIQIVYNYPVALDTKDVVLRYNGSVFTDGAAGVDIATTATLSAGNTILTIHPAQTPPVHALLNIVGNVSATVYGKPMTSPIYNNINLYVFDPTPLSDGSPVYADNFNAQTAKAGKSGIVSLKFSERVYGTATILSYTQNGKTTVPATASTVPLDGWGGDVWRDKAFGGCTAGTCGGEGLYYRAILSGLPNMEDNQAGVSNTVTVAIDAADAEGNRLNKTVTLSVE